MINPEQILASLLCTVLNVTHRQIDIVNIRRDRRGDRARYELSCVF